MIVLAHELPGVPWSELLRWSPARRLAALVALGESRGGKFRWATLTMDWPKP